jgi:hypothetical protein
LALTIPESQEGRDKAALLFWAPTVRGSSGKSENYAASGAMLARAGVPLVHVPYRGAGPAVADALGGQIQATIVTLPAHHTEDTFLLKADRVEHWTADCPRELVVAV